MWRSIEKMRGATGGRDTDGIFRPTNEYVID